MLSEIVTILKEHPRTFSSITILAILTFWSTSKKSKLPPGPLILPFIGDYGIIKAVLRKQGYSYIHSLFIRYGPIARTADPLGHTYYVVSDPHEAKRIFTDTDTFVRGPILQQLGTGLFENALFVIPTGDLWKRHRKLIQPAFGPSHLKHALSAAITSVYEIYDIWDRELKSLKQINVNMHQVLTAMALDVIGIVAFGESLNSIKNLSAGRDATWKDLETITTDIVLKRSISPAFLWSFFGYSTTSPRIALAKDNVMKYMQNLAQKRKEMIQNKAILQEGYQMDVLHRLLLSSQQNLMTEDEVMGEIIGFFIAGHETTANTVTSCFLDLSLHPEICDKLYNEIKSVNLKDLTTDSLSKLTYLDKVLKESQRLHSVTPYVPRIALKETTVCGYQVDVGIQLLVNLYSINMDPKIHENPELFNPERFNEPMVSGSFLPFGDGPHNCIGQKMALIQSKVMLIGLVQKYRFELVKDSPVEFVHTLTMGLKNGLFLTVQDRVSN
ncbi:cytochrome P450 [Globomyces pollinis-pini]|nr:cytochrome P450 [Globomyces pollinis-pini]